MGLAARFVVVGAIGCGLGGCVAPGAGDGENRPPVIDEQTSSQAVAEEDRTFAFVLHAYDLDGDDLAVVGLSSAGRDAGAITLREVTRSIVDGVSHLEAEIAITPRPDYNGTDGVSVSVSDGETVSGEVLFFRIEPVNDPPVARDDFYAVPVNAPLEISAPTLLVNDDDAADLYVECSPDECITVHPPSYGLAVSAAGAATGGTLMLVDGTIRFDPAPDFAGTALFDYTITDGEATAGATVHVMVGGPNTSPVAADDDVTLVESWRDIHQSLLVANDLDIDGHSLTVTGVANPTGGSVELIDGVVTVSPDWDEMSFDYTISDGTSSSVARATVHILYFL